MEIPIFGRKISVRFISDKELQSRVEDMDAEAYYHREVVNLSSALEQERAKRVLMHEMSHSILDISGVTNLLSDKQEEAVCCAFECLLEVFRDEAFCKFLNSRGED